MFGEGVLGGVLEVMGVFFDFVEYDDGVIE